MLDPKTRIERIVVADACASPLAAYVGNACCTKHTQNTLRAMPARALGQPDRHPGERAVATCNAVSHITCAGGLLHQIKLILAVARLAVAATSAVVKRRNEHDPCVKHCIRRTQAPTPVLACDTPLSLAAGGDLLRLPILLIDVC
ncbi:hypothetical protein VDG03_12715 [Xanthomonas campestris pv. raphani]|uniref:hypothetical protein n=1 Tax=Xanthomonas campestris TaxID=339 RepID=UPI002B22648B|nr:hypothetical protein [Xanthomonas campestris]MEA9751866.1 hypothetical protein [Xanthomonas campestris pv. raphani]MEA9812210.1 hypothetical protein [Xanthomonas campestris pv. raphani]